MRPRRFLSPRLFPFSITRRREGDGTRDSFGEYVPGVMVEEVLRANVQPKRTDDVDSAGGVAVVERLVAYVQGTETLRAAFDEARADEVITFGKTYVVERSESWNGHHTKAILLRHT